MEKAVNELRLSVGKLLSAQEIEDQSHVTCKVEYLFVSTVLFS